MNDVLVYPTIMIYKRSMIKKVNLYIIIILEIQNLRIPYAHIANGKPVY